MDTNKDVMPSNPLSTLPITHASSSVSLPIPQLTISGAQPHNPYPQTQPHNPFPQIQPPLQPQLHPMGSTFASTSNYREGNMPYV